MEIVHSPTDSDRLFGDDGQPLARTTDPITSTLAAASVTHLRAKQVALLTILMSVGGYATDGELANHYTTASQHDSDRFPPQSPSGLRTRRAELVRHGLVEATEDRGLTESGRQCVVWRATSDGITAGRRSVA